MAGETPGANASRRKKLNWQDDKSTNKIYASGDISALGTQTQADTVKKPEGQAGVPTPVVRADDKSADKYYANGGSSRVRGPQAALGQKKLGPPPKLGVTAQKPMVNHHPSSKLFVGDQTQINGVLQQLVEQLKGGSTGVVLSVKKGDSSLLRRTRASLEMLVTREVITEEMYHEVRLSYEQDAVLPLPEPKEVVAAKVDETIGDPKDFLDSDDDQETIDTSPLPAATEVDTSDDVPTSPAPAHPTAPEADDDDSDYDPVRGEQANTVLVDDKQEVEVHAETPAEPTTEEAPVDPPADATSEDESSKPRRGRRSGRGTN